MAKRIIAPTGNSGQLPGIPNSQILLMGATALGTIRTGYPSQESYDQDQVAIAENWLFYWSIAAHLAKTRAEFIEVMSFLLYP